MTFAKWKKRLANVILTFFVMFSFVVWKSFFLAYSLKLELGFLSSLLSNPNYNFKLETRATHRKLAKSHDGTKLDGKNSERKLITAGSSVPPMLLTIYMQERIVNALVTLRSWRYDHPLWILFTWNVLKSRLAEHWTRVHRQVLGALYSKLTPKISCRGERTRVSWLRGHLGGPKFRL